MLTLEEPKRRQGAAADDQAERLKLAMEAARLGDWSWREGETHITLSPRAAEIFGIASGHQLSWGQVQQLINDADRESARVAVTKALADRQPYEVEYRVRRPSDGREVWLLVRGQARYGGSGETVSMVGVVADITATRAAEAQMREAEAALRESEQRFRLIAETAPVMLWMGDHEGACIYLNRALREFWGVPEDLGGFSWSQTLHPDDAEGVFAAFGAAMAEQRAFEIEARYRRADGEIRWLHTTATPRFEGGDRFMGMIGVNVDVTDARRAEAYQRLLINELNHRVKNTLATVQSLAHQTLREGVQINSARDLLTARLLALSAAHNVLTRENWEGADLAEIAQEALRPFEAVGPSRIDRRGPRVRLGPRAAVSLSMALHELATNAVKYGALSAPAGRIDLDWSLEGQQLTLSWKERGGPRVSPPSRRGFGSRLLSSGLAMEIGGEARLEFAPDGLVCTIEGRLEAEG